MILNKFIKDNITYICLDMPDTDIFYYNVMQKLGSSLERMYDKLKDVKIYGLSHLIEHLSFKSTSKYSTAEIKHFARNLGDFNAYTSTNNVAYFAETISLHYKKIISIINSIAFNDLTRITENELNIEKNIVTNECNLIYDNSKSYFDVVALAKAFSLNQCDNIFGDLEVIKNTSLSQLIEIKKQLLNKHNLVIFIVYDSNHLKLNTIIKDIEKSLAEYNISSNRQEYSILIDKVNSVNTSMNLGHYKHDNDYNGILVKRFFKSKQLQHNQLACILSDFINYTSKYSFFEYVREKKGLCYSVELFPIKVNSTEIYYLACEIPNEPKNVEIFNASILKSIEKIVTTFNQRTFSKLVNNILISEKLKFLNRKYFFYYIELFDNFSYCFPNEITNLDLVSFIEKNFKEQFTYTNVNECLQDMYNIFSSQKYYQITNK